MATLEVHDKAGRVQFVELTRDHPVLFGTSSACDVVLDGEFIRPVHGRIRWKSRRFKVEASPDAEYVVINGHKMTVSSIHQGDEITVGDCRMFLIRADEELEKAGQKKSTARGGPDPESPAQRWCQALTAAGAATRGAIGMSRRFSNAPTGWMRFAARQPVRESNPGSRRWRCRSPGRSPASGAKSARPRTPQTKPKQAAPAKRFAGF